MAVTDAAETTGAAAGFPLPMPKTTALARRLSAASRKKSFDPYRDIDWSVPIDDSAYHLPPEKLTLFGTRQWFEMSDAERIAYSRHEAAALCGTGIWLENILMRILVDRLYELSPGDAIEQYLLVEVGDECRHSTMFAEFVRRAGTPAYRPEPRLRALGRLVRSVYGASSAFVAVLAAEELLDSMNRATSADKRLHPVTRAIARIHVTEEARHVSLARSCLRETYPKLGRAARAGVALLAPFTVRVVANATVNPAVFASLGLPGGADAARDNPHHVRGLEQDLASLTGFLAEIGIIDRWTRPLWNKLRLLA